MEKNLENKRKTKKTGVVGSGKLYQPAWPILLGPAQLDPFFCCTWGGQYVVRPNSF